VFDQGSTPEEAGNIAIVRSWIDALEGNSDAAYLAPAADDLTVETVERTQPMHGKDDLRAYFKSMHKAIGQLDTTVNNTVGVGQFVIVDYSIAGEQIGPLGWIPAQRDKVFRLDTVSIAELAGGKIAHVWRYDNPGQMVTGSP
jgi:hypothetical protein